MQPLTAPERLSRAILLIEISFEIVMGVTKRAIFLSLDQGREPLGCGGRRSLSMWWGLDSNAEIKQKNFV